MEICVIVFFQAFLGGSLDKSGRCRAILIDPTEFVLSRICSQERWLFSDAFVKPMCLVLIRLMTILVKKSAEKFKENHWISRYTNFGMLTHFIAIFSINLVLNKK